jgi:hypothetical protein
LQEDEANLNLIMRQDEKKEIHFEDADPWIERARKDYAAFRLLRSKDPALSVYLLQQSVEKIIKALAVASGQYTFQEIKSKFSHKSRKLLLDFWPKLEDAPGSTLPEMIEMADATPEEVLVTLQFIERLHDQSLSIINKSNFKTGDTLTLSFSGVVESLQNQFSYFSGGQSAIPEELRLPNLTFKVFLELIATGNSRKIVARRFLGKWSLITLFILASITFRHEDTSRYPDHTGRGCNNYNDTLGIVKHRDRLGNIFEMTLNYIDCVLERVSELFRANDRAE